MKRISTFLLILCAILIHVPESSAQTNTFPTSGNVGIGTTSPTSRLDIRGKVTIDNTGNAVIFTGIGNREFNRYLTLINSAIYTTASGLKAGGILVADRYDFAEPGKNDLIVKGNVGLGTANPQAKLDIWGGFSISGSNPVAGINGFKNVLQIKTPNHAAIVYHPREATELMFGFHNDGNFYWGTGVNYAMRLSGTGNARIYNALSVGGELKAGSKLSVNGKIAAREVEVSVSNWPDYVFEEDYHVQPLAEIEAFIRENKHLPGIPDKRKAEEEGIDLGEMNRKLLEKVEELTLYLIEKDRELGSVKERLSLLEERISDK